MTCSVEGCDSKLLAKSLCSKHYQRSRAYGDPLLGGWGTPGERLLLGHSIDQASGCWNWTKHLDKDGYGILKVNGRDTKAHRFSYEHYVGPISEGLVIDHLCRNRKCVNPNHLEPVTPRTNVLRGKTITAKNKAKTHCIRGHEFSGANLSFRAGGRRKCLACQRHHNRKQKGDLNPTSEFRGRWPKPITQITTNPNQNTVR